MCLFLSHTCRSSARKTGGGRKARSSSSLSPSSGIWSVTEAVEQMLPIRSVFGHRGANASSSTPSAIIRTGGGYGSGPTSLLASIVSRATARTKEATEDDDDEDGDLISCTDANQGLGESQVWQAWDDSCTPYSRKDRWGVAFGEAVSRASNGIGGSSNDAIGGNITTSSSSYGVYDKAGLAKNNASRKNGAWDRFEGITPPSMHQLRYHLQVSKVYFVADRWREHVCGSAD